MKKTHHKTHKKLAHIHALFVLCSAGLLSFIFITYYLQLPENKPTPIAQTKKHKNPVDLQIAQYSDKHITKNAIDSNQKFSSLALADFLTDEDLISPRSQMANVGSLFGEKKEYGTWLWTPLFEITKEYADSIIKEAKAAGLNKIYLSLDSYLDIYVMPDVKEKTEKRKEFENNLEYFVTLANKAGIDVDAEAGWRNWAEDGNLYKAFAIINFVREFNKNEKYKISGFQYDVEPYLLATYKTDQSRVLKNYLNLIEQTNILLGGSDLKFSVVIPYFYDKTSGLTKPFEYDGETDFAYNHLLNILDKRPESKIIVMSYRNFADGNDGSVDISNTEVAEATNGMYLTKIIVAQETGDVLPPYITFNNTSKNYYSKEIEKINKAFEPYQNFGGIAVHYVNAFLTLK